MASKMFEEMTLFQAINLCLSIDCPVMSGNMHENIKVQSIGEKEIVIEISGPSYDITKWRKTGVVYHTNKYDYAKSVYMYGGFHTMNKSRHWTARSLNRACEIIAPQYGAIVINKLEL